MPVDSRHTSYDANKGKWERIRAVLAGHDAMMAGGGAYVPRLDGQSDHEYAAYRNRAAFHDATSRTVDGLVGAVFRKPPAFDGVPEALETSFARPSVPATVFAKEAVREVIELGRYGVLIDVPPDGGEPYAVGYPAEDIINWRMTIGPGGAVLTMVVLRETSEERDPDDIYATKEVERFRVLSLEAPEGGAPRYSVRVWQKVADRKDQWEAIEEVMPSRRGAPLDFIPFVFLSPTSLSPAIEKSPIDGLARVNVAHWGTSCDLKHGAHYTALPTAVIAGEFSHGATGTDLRIGSSIAWHLNEGARWGMLEFTGAGLGAIRQIREDEKKDMAVLGARLLEDQKAAAEAAQTVQMRHRGEASVLASIADTVGRGLSQAASWAVWWAGGGEGVAKVTLNTDFVENPLTPREMVELIAGWQSGGFGGATLFHNLRDGERLPEGMTFDDWLKDIEDNGPAGAFMGDIENEGEAPPDEEEEGEDEDG